MRAGAAMVLFAAFLLGGCHGGSAKPDAAAQDLSIGNAWVRLAPTPPSPSAAYFTIHGGKVEDRLTAVSSPQVARAEMHETMTGERGVATMVPLRDVVVPAGGTISFAPAGRHVMLFGLDPAVTAGREIRLDLAFGSGRTLSAPARVRAIGDDRQ